MRFCSRCALPETFPGIRFNGEGVCQFCLSYKGPGSLEEKKQEYQRNFERLVEEYRGKSAYDALMSYSGGKDSTYTLWILNKRYGLNVLALTFDNGFLPWQTLKNIRIVTEKFDLDHFFSSRVLTCLKKCSWDVPEKISFLSQP